MTKVAAIQLCSGLNLDRNLKIAGELIKTAAENHAKLIILPEMFAVLGNAVKNKEDLGHGKIQDFLSHIAQEHKIWIIGGTIPLSTNNPHKIKAACLIFDDTGKNRAEYNKMNLFDVAISETEKYAESDTTEPGNKTIVINTPFGKLGLAVCYDIRFPELFKKLLQQGCEIIALPAAFTVPTGEAHWEVLARATAIYNLCYFMGACQGGTHDTGRKTYGHSLIIDPWGKIIAEKPDNKPGIIYADIDLQEVYKARKIIPLGVTRSSEY